MENIIEIFMSRGMSRKAAEKELATLTREYKEIVDEVIDPEEAYSELESLFRRFGLSMENADELAMG